MCYERGMGTVMDGSRSKFASVPFREMLGYKPMVFSICFCFYCSSFQYVSRSQELSSVQSPVQDEFTTITFTVYDYILQSITRLIHKLVASLHVNSTTFPACHDFYAAPPSSSPSMTPSSPTRPKNVTSLLVIRHSNCPWFF